MCLLRAQLQAHGGDLTRSRKVCLGSHIDNVVGSDINQNDMGHDTDTASGNTAFGDSDDIQQVSCRVLANWR